jgi:hypothetical protein
MRYVFALAGIIALLLTLSCGSSGPVAPGGSRLILSADPEQIAFNGSSTLTVFGTDENGTLLPDGTQVSFSVAQAGSVSPSSVSLMDGTATTTFTASFSAGEVTVTATSGSVEASITITVADDEEQRVIVSATPATLPQGGGTSLISAVVTDVSGTPLEDIGVVFSTTSGSLQSNGATIRTSDTGVAIDTLNTSTNATVTATTDDGFSGETTVETTGGRIVCHMTVSDSTPQVGQNILFLDTSDIPQGEDVEFHWNFGDGSSSQGRTVQHRFQTAGTFSILHSVIDENGNTFNCDPFPLTVN